MERQRATHGSKTRARKVPRYNKRNHGNIARVTPGERKDDDVMMGSDEEGENGNDPSWRDPNPVHSDPKRAIVVNKRLGMDDMADTIMSEDGLVAMVCVAILLS